MDDPDLAPALHDEALDALGRIHKVSFTSRRILAEVSRVARSAGPAVEEGEPVRVLDVGCGDGGVLIEVARRAALRGITVHVHGVDLSPAALARAERQAEHAAVSFQSSCLDVTRDPLPRGFDLVTCSLFLHHLADDDAHRLLEAMAGAGTVALVQDLRRTWLGFVFAWVGVRLLSRSPVARVDGPRSVRAAFTLEEVRRLSRLAGMPGAQVCRAWPQRFTWTWRAPS